MTRVEPKEVEGEESSAFSSRRSLPQNRIAHTLNALGNGQQNAGNERLAVVRLLENDNLLSETRTGDAKLVSADAMQVCLLESAMAMTYVPGFWSWKGVNSTVWTDMAAAQTRRDQLVG
jgi:hypothetical protein